MLNPVQRSAWIRLRDDLSVFVPHVTSHHDALTDELKKVEIVVRGLTLRQALAVEKLKTSRDRLRDFQGDLQVQQDEIDLFRQAASDSDGPFSPKHRSSEDVLLKRDIDAAVEREQKNLTHNEQLIRTTQSERADLDSRLWRLKESHDQFGSLVVNASELLHRVEDVLEIDSPSPSSTPIPRSPSLTDLEHSREFGSSMRRYQSLRSSFVRLREITWPPSSEFDTTLKAYLEAHPPTIPKKSSLAPPKNSGSGMMVSTSDDSPVISIEGSSPIQIVGGESEAMSYSWGLDDPSPPNALRSRSPHVSEVLAHSPPNYYSSYSSPDSSPSPPKSSSSTLNVYSAMIRNSRKKRSGGKKKKNKAVRTVSPILEVGRDDQDEEVVAPAGRRQLRLLQQRLQIKGVVSPVAPGRVHQLSRRTGNVQDAGSGKPSPRLQKGPSRHPFATRQRQKRRSRNRKRRKRKTISSPLPPPVISITSTSSIPSFEAPRPFLRPSSPPSRARDAASSTLRRAFLSSLFHSVDSPPPLTDVSIRASDSTFILAHQSLMSRSPVLQSSFLTDDDNGDLEEDDFTCCLIELDSSEGIGGEAVRCVVAYCYGREELLVEERSERVLFQVFRLGMKWRLYGLCRVVLRFLTNSLRTLDSIVDLCIESEEWYRESLLDDEEEEDLLSSMNSSFHLICLQLLKGSYRDFLSNERLCRRVQSSNPELWFRLARLAVVDLPAVPSSHLDRQFQVNDEATLMDHLESLHSSQRCANLAVKTSHRDEDPHVFPVHAEILAARCKYFGDILSAPTSHYTIRVPLSLRSGIRRDDFRAVLWFIYTSQLSATIDSASLLQIALIGGELSVMGLAHACTASLTSRLKNQRDVIELCLHHGSYLRSIFPEDSPLWDHCRMFLQQISLDYLMDQSILLNDEERDLAS